MKIVEILNLSVAGTIFLCPILKLIEMPNIDQFYVVCGFNTIIINLVWYIKKR